MGLDVKIQIPVFKKIDDGNGRGGKQKRDLNIQPYRRLIQFGFLLVLLWIGAEFILFVSQLERGITPTISRPPGVEGFLPISALMSLRYWLLTGVFNKIHPSSLVLLLIIMATAVVLKKGFCSWVCPFGLLSEYLAKLHRRIFDRTFRLPRVLDYPLRSLKYLLLLFFVWAIFVQMNVLQLQVFIYSPYNRVADIKMLKFFTDMSSTTFWTLVILVLLSTLIPYFWCRYLCPYGAFLGALSWFSPFKIHRNRETCIDCGKCSVVCPSHIQVHKSDAVFSDECHACLQCVDVCPVEDTLYFSATRRHLKMPKWAYAVLIVAFFLVGTTIARLTGYWHNAISVEEYKQHIKQLNSPLYYHNRGTVPKYDPNQFGVPDASKAGDSNDENRNAE